MEEPQRSLGLAADTAAYAAIRWQDWAHCLRAEAGKPFSLVGAKYEDPAAWIGWTGSRANDFETCLSCGNMADAGVRWKTVHGGSGMSGKVALSCKMR
eukprot:scaffold1220_cov259-Pinguiococcus_pyrenoidosus.AAC.108